jgi:glycine/sarcosine N-methyltransferase
MPLYASLASAYDDLFPVAPAAAAFLDASASRGKARPRAAGLRALDAGCATGAHALALARLGWTADGVDSEAAMIAAARESARRAGLAGCAAFSQADILDIGKTFAKDRFDLILCLGNTLPHLVDGGAASFLAQARGLLAPDGELVLQTLNFALPGVGPGYAFPELAAGGAVMKRSYAPPPPGKPGALRFVVELTKEGRTDLEETILEPLPPSRIASLLADADFASMERYSGWDGRPFDESSDPYLVIVAKASAEGSSRR